MVYRLFNRRLLLLLLCIQSCLASSLWSFSIRPVQVPRKGFKPFVLTARQNVITAHSASEICTHGVSPSVCCEVLRRFVARSMSTTVGKVKYSQRNSLAVVSLRFTPLAFRNVPLQIRYTGPRSGDTNTSVNAHDIVMEWASRGTCSNGLRVVSSVVVNAEKITVRTEAQGAGLSNEDLLSIIGAVESVLRAELQRSVDLALARRTQAAERHAAAQAATEREQRKKLDRILHPEKHTSKAGTVRKTPGDGGGRYTPSAATQARRQVKRGG